MNTSSLPQILVVEDNSDDLRLLRRAFEKAQVVNPLQVASDGEDAIAQLEQMADHPSDSGEPPVVLVLLDLRLPRKSGLDVLRWIRQNPRTCRIPVVVLSNSQNDVDIRRAYELGANSYLIKPVSFDALLEMVQVLHLYWIRFNTPPPPESPPPDFLQR